MIEVLSSRLQRRKDCLAEAPARVMSFDRVISHLAPLSGLIGRPWQPATIARRACLSRKRHARGHHPFEPAHPIAKVGDLLADPPHIDRGVAHTLVEEDDLAERPYCVAIKAHAA